MFTKQDKIKELIDFLFKNTKASCLIHQSKQFPPVGVSVVMTYKYNIKGIEIIYNKWFVECFEEAKQFNLPGCEHHNQLVKGSGVLVCSEKLGTLILYGKAAQDIINMCETYCDRQPCIIKPLIPRQR